MKRRTALRNAAIAALLVLVIFAVAMQQMPAAAAPPQVPRAAPLTQADFSWQTTSGTLAIQPGQSGLFSSVLRNTGQNDIFDLRVDNLPSGWTVDFSPSASFELVQNQSQGVTVRINVPANATVGTSASLNLVARRRSNNADTTAFITVNVASAPTPTNTPVGPTATRGPVCRDGFEDDNNPASARTLDINTAQEHTICPTGDEDWLVFGGIAGKVYTIDVSRMDAGIDLTLELFDPELNSIAFNNDFFNRDPANPNPGDTRPRITIRIPTDGRYFVRVRDAAGRGGTNYFYVIALLDESYGPTPTTVASVCQDLFEPDGLPEQARLITSNEIQEDRRLCPTGDADWVTFFGKTGKRYIIYTDTRRYRGRIEVNRDTQAGADTVMVLTDRDGVSILDFNDDIPGGESLDSQIEFIPEVDGFYFAQVKNTGDIGNQFIRYDLVLLLCTPGQTDCGRASVPGQPISPITPAPTGTPDQDFNLDPTRTPVPTPRPTPRA